MFSGQFQSIDSATTRLLTFLFVAEKQPKVRLSRGPFDGGKRQRKQRMYVIWCGIQSNVIHVPVDTSFLYYGPGSCLVRSASHTRTGSAPSTSQELSCISCRCRLNAAHWRFSTYSTRSALTQKVGHQGLGATVRRDVVRTTLRTTLRTSSFLAANEQRAAQA